MFCAKNLERAALMLAQLRDVLDSFACRDVAKAVEVWTRDQDIDRLCTSLSQQRQEGPQNPTGRSREIALTPVNSLSRLQDFHRHVGRA